jgi:PTH1 family peptidyl-tRNA hydrolase
LLQLVAFLGNPGLEYEHSRHNAGWMLAEALPFFPTLNWQNKFKALYSCMSLGETDSDRPEKFHFIKPQTYMNLSGESVKMAAAFYKTKLDQIIVVHDEIELPFGTVSLKFSGGLGGHNGLRSMKACFGNADFWRLRIGIGRPDDRIPGKGGSMKSIRDSHIADWVLSSFSDSEADALIPVFNAGAGLLVQALATGPECLQPDWSKRNCLAETPSLG